MLKEDDFNKYENFIKKFDYSRPSPDNVGITKCLGSELDKFMMIHNKFNQARQKRKASEMYQCLVSMRSIHGKMLCKQKIAMDQIFSNNISDNLCFEISIFDTITHAYRNYIEICEKECKFTTEGSNEIGDAVMNNINNMSIDLKKIKNNFLPNENNIIEDLNKNLFDINLNDSDNGDEDDDDDDEDDEEETLNEYENIKLQGNPSLETDRLTETLLKSVDQSSTGEPSKYAKSDFLALFYVDWCKNCDEFKQIWKMLNDIIDTSQLGIFEFNGDSYCSVASHLGISSWPTVILYKRDENKVYNVPINDKNENETDACDKIISFIIKKLNRKNILKYN